MDLAARPAGYTELSPLSLVRLLVPSCSRPARTSLTVALRAILDPPLRATAALIEAAGTGECSLGAELENWGKKKKRRETLFARKEDQMGP
jgi:hypothetical protein